MKAVPSKWSVGVTGDVEDIPNMAMKVGSQEHRPVPQAQAAGRAFYSRVFLFST